MTSDNKDSLLLCCILASVFVSKQKEKKGDIIEDLAKHLLPQSENHRKSKGLPGLSLTIRPCVESFV